MLPVFNRLSAENNFVRDGLSVVIRITKQSAYFIGNFSITLGECELLVSLYVEEACIEGILPIGALFCNEAN